MHLLLQDLRYALRMMRKSPVFSIVVILSLAIGIGANTAMFSILNSLFLHPLRFPESNRLVMVWLSTPGLGIARDWPSPGLFNDIQTQSQAFDELALALGRNATMTGLKQPERVQTLRSTSALLRVLGAEPLLGRLFLPEEDKPGQPDTAVITYGTWKRLFGSDPNILQRNITVDGDTYAVVGVLKPEFVLNREVMPTNGGIDEAEVFLPLPLSAGLLNNYIPETHNVLGRLKPGVTLQAAQADLDIISQHIRERDQRDRTFSVKAVSLIDQVVGNVRQALFLLFGAVGFVLLIACANIANLLLSRAMGRQKEMGLRTAVGAGHRRLIRQLLTESVLMGLIGGASGLGLAVLSLQTIRTVNPGNIPRLAEITIDSRVLIFTLVVSILTGIIFGLGPAMRVLKLDLNSVLKEGGRHAQGASGFDPRRHRLRSFLVVAEIALSLMLLVGSGLLVRSFSRILNVSPGFNPDHLVTMKISLTDLKYRDQNVSLQFYQNLDRRIRNIPGLVSAGYVSSLPMATLGGWGDVDLQGYVPPPEEREIQVDERIASPSYFETMGIPLKKGRFFTPDDMIPNGLNNNGDITKPRFAIIDDNLASRYWADKDPLGKHIRPSSPLLLWNTIVGVVGSAKQNGLDLESHPVVYYAYSEFFAGSAYIVARTAVDPLSMTGDIARAVRATDPDVAVYDVDTMENRLHRSLARQRFSVIILAAFALVALVLACVGVYGVLSNVVAEGTRDISIRMMLGAQRDDVFRLVFKYSMGLVLVGIVSGLVGAFILGHLMRGMLYEVSGMDIPTFSVVALFLVVIALAASYVPARRVMSVDPVAAMRDE